MFWSVQVLIGRNAQSLNRTYTYWADASLSPKPLTRVIVDFAGSKDAVGLIVKTPKRIEDTLEGYSQKALHGIALKPIKSILDDAPLLSEALSKLADKLADYYFCPPISLYQAMLPPSLKPSESALRKPKAKFSVLVTVNPVPERDVLSATEKKTYDRIAAAPQGFVLKASLEKTKSYQSLKAKGLLIETKVRENRIKAVAEVKKEAALSPDQVKAYNAILASPKDTVLFQGVTGSGKTLIYLELAKHYLALGKGTILLVPEIALTDQTAALFKGAFHEKVSILHSGLSASNKLDEFLRIQSGEAQIVIGTRSAIFSPVKNLGLIILDEEHSSSYKQSNAPYYDARTVSRMRARIEGAKAVFASATPLVEDEFKAYSDEYGLVTLDARYSKAKPIEPMFIDMSDPNNFSKDSAMISLTLKEEIAKRVSNREQAILFLNRRGYAPMVQCRHCYRTLTCDECDIPFVFHRKEGVLMCHRCGKTLSIQGLTCPYCKEGKSFLFLGYGTEKVKEQLEAMIPGIRALVLDRDTATETKRAQILNAFREGKADVLIGTEMVAKGHDFPNVTLAAALCADQGLAVPSYLATENVFDVITQLIGRSGRGKKPGLSIIQTYAVTNPTLVLASRQDYEDFFQAELLDRYAYHVPPFYSLCDFDLSSKDLRKAKVLALSLKTFLKDKLKGIKGAGAFGPAYAPVAKMAGVVTLRIIVKFKDRDAVHPILDEALSLFTRDAAVKVSLDMDPRGD